MPHTNTREALAGQFMMARDFLRGQPTRAECQKARMLSMGAMAMAVRFGDRRDVAQTEHCERLILNTIERRLWREHQTAMSQFRRSYHSRKGFDHASNV